MEDRAGFWCVRAWTAVELPYEGDPVTARYQQGRQMVLQPRRSSARNWAALALGTLLLLQSPFANAATVTVDPSIEYQQIDGFGASVAFQESSLVNLPEPKRSQALDLLFGDLGATILRFRINADLERTNDNADPFDTDLSSYNWNSNSDARWVAQQALARGVIDTVWAACWSPPGWMKDNGDSNNGGHVLPSMYDELAEYYYAYTYGMQSFYGFPIHMISLFNEPGFETTYESTETTPAEYRDILKVVGQRFVDEGLADVGFLGPDTINPNHPTSGGKSFLDAIIGDPVAAAFLSVGATHQYGETGSFDWVGFASRCQSLNIPAWQSEMAKLNDATDDISGALEMNWWMWIALAQGNCSSWHHWSYYWLQEAGKAQGLMSISGRPPSDFSIPKRYYAFKQFSRLVLPGSIRVHAASDSPDLYALAFKRPDELIVIAFNRTGSDIPATFSVPGAIGDAIHVRSSATEDYARQPDLPVAGQGFSLNVNAESISTFIIPTSPALGSSFLVNWVGGANIAAFTDSGNLYLRGTLAEQSSPQDTPASEFLIRHSSGSVILAVDQAGNMSIAGSVYTGRLPLLPGPSDELLVKDLSGKVAAVVTSSGDIYLRGFVWTGITF